MPYQPMRGAFPIELDRPRFLYFDRAASALLMEKFGVSFNFVLEVEADSEGKATLDLDKLQFCLWAGLQHEGRLAEDPLHYDACEPYLVAWRILEIRNLVRSALLGATYVPPEPKPLGKEPAADPAPAPAAPGKTPAKKKGSTSLKPRGLRLAR